MVLRDREIVGLGNYDRLYVQQDANYNVTALVDTTGAVAERYAYDPYGSVTVLAPAGEHDLPRWPRARLYLR
jgi:hypothetical protein